jgi:ElaB/YqjD/DUF883 family membrane-anchored ribosome-binding protein
MPNLADVGTRLRKKGRDARHCPKGRTDKETNMRSTTPTTNTVGNPIARDIQNVVSDAQELLKTVQAESESKLADVKTKVHAQLDSAKQMIGQLQTTVHDGAKVAMDTTDAYVRTNPWRAIGISAALGALIGFLAARK